MFFTHPTLLNRCLYYVKWVRLTVHMPRIYVVQYSFFNSALDGGERLTSLPLALRPGNNLGIHRLGCWVGPKVTLDIFETEKNFHVLEFETRTVQCMKYERKFLEIGEV
jgi:hypothetical protein